ncbi:MAG: hypothetical protein Q9208_002117 [Pyrenodesmia sp. 3 TL-2023]
MPRDQVLGGLTTYKISTTDDHLEDEETDWAGPQPERSRKSMKAQKLPMDAHPKKSNKRKLGDRDFALDHIVLTKKVDKYAQLSTSEESSAAQKLIRHNKDVDAALKEMEAAAAALALVERSPRIPPTLGSNPHTNMDAMARWYCSLLRNDASSVNDERDERINRLEQELAASRALRDGDKAENVALKATCADLQAQKIRQDERLQKYVDRYQSLEANQALSTTNSSTLETRVGELTDGVKAMTRKFEAASKAKEQYETLYSDSIRSIRLLEARNLGLHAQIGVLSADVQSMAASRNRELEAQRSKWQRESERLSSAKQRLELESQNTRDDLLSEQKRHEDTRNEMVRVATERDEWSRKAASFEAQSDLNHQNAVAQTDQKEELDRTISTVRQTVEEQTVQIRGLREEVNDLHNQIFAKETEHRAQLKKVEDLGHKLDSTSNLHRKEARERAVAEGDLRRKASALEQHEMEARNLYGALQDKYSDSQTKLKMWADQLELKSRELEDLKRSLSQSEERVIAHDQRNVQDRDNATLEIKALLGVIPGDLRDTLHRLSIDSEAWRCTGLGFHQGCLLIGSSVLDGRPPMVMDQSNTASPLPRPDLQQETFPGPRSSLVVDIRYKIILTMLYLSNPVERRFIPQLWGIWATLEGTKIQSDDMGTLVGSLMSAANRIFRLFSEGTVDDLGFWITAQIVCSMMPWAFQEFDLSDILPPDHPSHRSTRPLVCAGVSRILMSVTGSQNEAGKSCGLFASLRSAAASSPDSCKHFTTEIDQNPANAVLYLLHGVDNADAREVLILLETVTGDCIFWHDKAEKCVVFASEDYATWLRLACVDSGRPLHFRIPDELGEWMEEQFELVQDSDPG